MTRLRVSRLIVGAATVVGLLLGTSPAAAAPAPGARVTASPDGFALDGRAWWPTGFNAYQLATDWSVNWGSSAP